MNNNRNCSEQDNVVNLGALESVPLLSINHKRQECGTLYNKCSNEMAIFGGNVVGYSGYKSPGNLMEIYDFHKNVWIDLPWKAHTMHSKYLCVRSIGGKCIFVHEYGKQTQSDHQNKTRNHYYCNVNRLI